MAPGEQSCARRDVFREPGSAHARDLERAMDPPAAPELRPATAERFEGRQPRAGPGTPSADCCSSCRANPSASGSRGPRIHTNCAVVSAPTLDRAFARWGLTVECDRPSLWAAASPTRRRGPRRQRRPHGLGGRWADPRSGRARSLMPAAWPPRPTHPVPRSGSRRLLTLLTACLYGHEPAGDGRAEWGRRRARGAGTMI
jgi:hypothetical protein